MRLISAFGYLIINLFKKSVTKKFVYFKHSASNGISDVIQLHSQFISFREANELNNRPSRPIIMSAAFCVGLRLIKISLKISKINNSIKAL